MSTRSKWVVYRNPRRVELVEVIVGGEKIDRDRIIRVPGTDYQYQILALASEPVEGEPNADSNG